jgi:hypothetical protein
MRGTRIEIEELLETVSSTQSVSRCYNRDGLEATSRESEKGRLGGWSEMVASLNVSQLKQ